jgi:hypothetical protein
MANNNVEIVFSFDATTSMYPCLTQVRRKIKTTVARLMKELPDIRIGIITHGDYDTPYTIKKFDLSRDVDAICNFVEKVEMAMGGSTYPECYELALHEALSFAWTPEASKALVLIGDDVPHTPNETEKNIDWRAEAAKLTDMGIPVHSVQALNRSYANWFYTELAEKTGGTYLTLDQFSYITDLFLAVCYKQYSDIKLHAYQQEVIKERRMNRGLSKIFSAMTKQEVMTEDSVADLRAVPPGRFQILDIDKEAPIKTFVQENGLSFKTGRGFYEFTKTETIQSYKEIILMDRNTGDLFEGEYARELLGLPAGVDARIKPANLEKYAVFVQSTSANRKLIKNTRFLYEVEDWDYHSND